MKNLLLISFLLLSFFVFESEAQHFIGSTKDETKLLAQKSGFFPDEMTKNQSFNYLKFVNSPGTKTLIVFFNDEQIATSSKIICDYSEYDFVVDANNKNYNKKGENEWEYKIANDYFTVDMEEKEWYFVLRVKKK